MSKYFSWEKFGWLVEKCERCNAMHLHLYYKFPSGKKLLKVCITCKTETEGEYAQMSALLPESNRVGVWTDARWRWGNSLNCWTEIATTVIDQSATRNTTRSKETRSITSTSVWSVVKKCRRKFIGLPKQFGESCKTPLIFWAMNKFFTKQFEERQKKLRLEEECFDVISQFVLFAVILIFASCLLAYLKFKHLIWLNTQQRTT
jgi:hypothetical protein